MLKNIFDMDNPVMQALSTAADLLVLNLLALLCCLPVVTAGAAWTALHDVVQKIVLREESYPYRMFIDSFRANLKKGSLLGMIFLTAACLIILNYFAALATLPSYYRFLPAAALLLLLAIGNYAFALMARFENTLTGTLKNAVRLAIGCFPRTLGMVAFETAVYVGGIHFYAVGVPLILLFGLSVPCYVCAVLYSPVFKQLEEKAAHEYQD